VSGMSCGQSAVQNFTSSRTFNIERRERRIGITLVVLYFISISVSGYDTCVIVSLLPGLAGVVH
jgi:hypothetical protein